MGCDAELGRADRESRAYAHPRVAGCLRAHWKHPHDPRYEREFIITESRRALIVIDAQNDYFSLNSPLQIQYPDRVKSLANITRAIDVAETQGIPIVVVQHEYPAGAPVFAVGSEGWMLHPEIKSRVQPSWKHLVKNFGSVFAGTDFESWLRENDVDTITLVGFMTNNCDLATAAAAEPLGFAVEVLSDASGAIHLANELGSVSAQQLHEMLLVLLHSNFAAVATTDEWAQAVEERSALPKSDLGTSAVQGSQAFTAATP